MNDRSLSTYTAETIVNTSIAYKNRISTSSNIIYTTVLLAVAGTVAALPFLKTKISVKSTTAILQPSAEKIEIQAPIGGQILKLMVKDNQKLKHNDTLLLIDGSVSDAKNALLQTQLSRLKQNLEDVNNIMNYLNNSHDAHHLSTPTLQTGQYQASWQQYTQELQKTYIAKDLAERTYKRYASLYHSKVLTSAEFEKYKSELDQAKSDYIIVGKRYKTQWQTEATKYQEDLRQAEGQLADLNEQTKRYILRAPIAGSFQSAFGLQVGSYVNASQKIGYLSPDDKLIAVCSIKPSDIGLIQEGQEVRIKVDAFNYNQWGLLTGKIVDISDDIVIENSQQPFFKVKCSLTKNYLQLKNGYKGYLKKGMTLSASFTVTERSLYQLLYDKVSDWLKPNQNVSSSKQKQ